jgi:hypothetical protein
LNYTPAVSLYAQLCHGKNFHLSLPFFLLIGYNIIMRMAQAGNLPEGRMTFEPS